MVSDKIVSVDFANLSLQLDKVLLFVHIVSQLLLLSIYIDYSWEHIPANLMQSGKQNTTDMV